MKRKTFLSLLIIFGVMFSVACNNNNDDDDNDVVSPAKTYEIVKITTSFGDIHIWLWDEAPLHKANFDSLANADFYDGLIFHRVVDDFVIQGGDPLGTGSGGPGYKIDAEIRDSLKHYEGAVGAARDNNPLKQSNGSQFYIVEDPTGAHFLDGNYTVFGQTIGGMNTVSAIASTPVDGNDKPLADVVMTKVEMISMTAQNIKTQFNFDVPL